MTNAFIRKLEHFTKLSIEDRNVILHSIEHNLRSAKAGNDIVREGERPTSVKIILAGWAYRYKQLEDGRRQIVAFFLPGDLCDLNVFILRAMDHSVGTITDVSYAELSRSAIEDITLKYPRITQALWWETLVMMATQREWTANMGQRNAFERVAHLFCELFIRLKTVGLIKNNNSYDFPITQAELGEATGLTSVHVNRTLQEMRAAKLITLREKTLTVLDWEGLRRASMFNANYLHLDRVGSNLDSND